MYIYIYIYTCQSPRLAILIGCEVFEFEVSSWVWDQAALLERPFLDIPGAGMNDFAFISSRLKGSRPFGAW